MNPQVSEHCLEGLAGAAESREPRNVRLTTIRTGTMAVAFVTLAVFLFSIHPYFSQLQDVCDGPACASDQLSPESAQVLKEIGVSVQQYALYFGGLAIAVALVWFGVAALIAWSRPNDPFALLVVLTLVLAGAFTVTGSVQAGSPMLASAIHAVNNLELVCFLLFLGLFPDGRFVPRWTRWIVPGAVALGIVLAVFPEAEALGPVWFLVAGTLLGAQVYRYQSVSGMVERQQTRWVVFSLVMVVVVVLGMFLVTEVVSSDGSMTSFRELILAPLSALVLLLIPVSIGIAILRFHLFAIDVIINRVLVYGALTTCVVAAYILVVGYLGALFRTGFSLPISLLGSGFIAVLFAPLRDRLHKAVNRLMYGDRDDPYAVLSNLGQRLEATIAPDAVLSVIVSAVRETIKLPYAAIMLAEDHAPVAKAGTPVKNLIHLPLTYQNEPIGTLLLGPRAGEEGFVSADWRLLEDLARQVGVAVHAVRLTTDLQSARERLVTAREEERRRLRRDLHDGLGPQLSGQALIIDAVRVLMRDDPEKADTLLLDLKSQAQDAVRDIRRLIYGLRPPALDDLGLLGALQESAAQYSQNGLIISVVAPKRLPPLPAAVEVAVYRIAREGIINAVRHAEARRCVVTLAVDDATGLLRLQIRDDGRGFVESIEAVPFRNGVGLFSMRERAGELGGHVTIESCSGEGTIVCAELPIMVEV